jgi:hypothetical protein
VLFDRTKFAIEPDFGGARAKDYRAGESVALPVGWKLTRDQNGEDGLQFVKVSHPAPSIAIVPTQE